MPYKHQTLSYRNIEGCFCQCWTADPSEFKAIKAYAKTAGLICRVIGGQLYLNASLL